MTTQTKCFIPQPNELKTFKLRLESWVKDTNNKEEKKLLKEALKHLEESDEAYFIALMSIAQSEFGISENMHISPIYSTNIKKNGRNSYYTVSPIKINVRINCFLLSISVLQRFLNVKTLLYDCLCHFHR